MGLRAYIAKRVIYTFILVCAVIIFNYILFVKMGNPTESFLPPRAGVPEDVYKKYIEGILKRWGLDQPLHVQIFKAFVNMITFNFGKSFVTGTPVHAEMAIRLPYTMFLLGSSTTAAIVIGILWGVLVASKRGSLFDSASVSTALIFYSLPVFWMGMILLFIFFIVLGWFPGGHAYPESWNLGAWPTPFTAESLISSEQLNVAFNINGAETLRLLHGYLLHATLPFITLTLFGYGGYMLLTRATMIDALTEDYVVTARAKGLPGRTVIFKHALKNASLPIITNVALSYAGIVSGAIITETVFSYPGMGRWIWTSILGYDYGVLMATFYVVALLVIAANFIADLLYGVIDPRIKY